MHTVGMAWVSRAYRRYGMGVASEGTAWESRAYRRYGMGVASEGTAWEPRAYKRYGMGVPCIQKVWHGCPVHTKVHFQRKKHTHSKMFIDKLDAR